MAVLREVLAKSILCKSGISDRVVAKEDYLLKRGRTVGALLRRIARDEEPDKAVGPSAVLLIIGKRVAGYNSAHTETDDIHLRVRQATPVRRGLDGVRNEFGVCRQSA